VLLSVCLRRLLKETSLVQFAAETAKELGIEIEDENEISYDLIECSNRTKQLLSQSSIVVSDRSLLILSSSSSSSSSSSTQNHNNSEASVGSVLSPPPPPPTLSPSMEKYQQKMKNKKIDYEIGGGSLLHSNMTTGGGQNKASSVSPPTTPPPPPPSPSGLVQDDYEATISVCLCALAMMKPATSSNVNDETWMQMATKFRTYPGILCLFFSGVHVMFTRIYLYSYLYVLNYSYVACLKY
jgi:hypothetical protein